MCSGLSFLIGLFLLFKGEFRFAERIVPRDKSRAIALILMAPVVIGACAGVLLLSGVSPDSITADLDPLSNAALSDVFLTATLIELVTLLIAVGLAVYNIYTIPKGGTPTGNNSTVRGMSMPMNSGRVSAAAAAPPLVMTLSEAAAYLRVSEAEVLALIESNRLGAARMGDSYRIAKRALDDFLSGDNL